MTADVELLPLPPAPNRRSEMGRSPAPRIRRAAWASLIALGALGLMMIAASPTSY